jgi:hypothetical protein
MLPEKYRITVSWADAPEALIQNSGLYYFIYDEV